MDDLEGRYRPQHGSDSDRESIFSDSSDPGRIVTRVPEKRFRLGYLSVMGLVVNRMIGNTISVISKVLGTARKAETNVWFRHRNLCDAWTCYARN
jgi:hypothetical protein